MTARCCISPKNHVPKSYIATLDRPLRGDEGDIFAAGTLMLEGEDKPLEPATLEVIAPNQARVTVTEGRYHQVRRMFAAVGNHVVALHRDRVGALALPDDLEPGAIRILGEAEITLVFGAGAGLTPSA
jgi:16S rRNA pseudouridine516 synthase